MLRPQLSERVSSLTSRSLSVKNRLKIWKTRTVPMRHGCPAGIAKLKCGTHQKLSKTKIRKCKMHNIDEKKIILTCQCMTEIMNGNWKIIGRQKGGDLTQSYDKSPYTNTNVKGAKWQVKFSKSKENSSAEIFDRTQTRTQLASSYDIFIYRISIQNIDF